MKVLFSYFVLCLIASCRAGVFPMMPYRNYSLSPERFIPLQYSDATQSVRVWVCRSTSVDTVYSISMYYDSSVKCFRQVIGERYSGKRKLQPFYSISKFQPKSGAKTFFNKIDSLNFLSVDDETDLSVVSGQPLSWYVVEYFTNGLYTKFRFHENYRSDSSKRFDPIQELLESELDLVPSSR